MVAPTCDIWLENEIFKLLWSFLLWRRGRFSWRDKRRFSKAWSSRELDLSISPKSSYSISGPSQTYFSTSYSRAMEILDVKKDEIPNVKVRKISSVFFYSFRCKSTLDQRFFCPICIWLKLGKRINDQETNGEKVSRACYCSLSLLFTSLNLFFITVRWSRNWSGLR